MVADSCAVKHVKPTDHRADSKHLKTVLALRKMSDVRNGPRGLRTENAESQQQSNWAVQQREHSGAFAVDSLRRRNAVGKLLSAVPNCVKSCGKSCMLCTGRARGRARQTSRVSGENPHARLSRVSAGSVASNCMSEEKLRQPVRASTRAIEQGQLWHILAQDMQLTGDRVEPLSMLAVMQESIRATVVKQFCLLTNYIVTMDPL